MTDDVTTVLITGVRGKTGVPLARSLAARGVAVRGGSSRPATVSLPGVVPTAFDWDEPTGWPSATDGVDAVYLVRPDRPDAPQLVAELVDQLSDDTRVVLLSERLADYPGLDGWALRVEDAVRRGGHGWAILRPSWFAQVFTDDRFYRQVALGGGELAFPSAGSDVAWIDAGDIAAVAEVALLTGVHDGEVLELSGPEALSLPRTAELLSEVASAPVVHREVPVDDAAAGLEGFERAITVVTFERVRDGSFAGVTGEVERVTGRPARSLAQVLADELGARD